MFTRVGMKMEDGTPLVQAIGKINKAPLGGLYFIRGFILRLCITIHTTFTFQEKFYFLDILLFF